jgi:hypothetical protein
MKTKKYYLILAVVTAILCVPTQGEIRPPLPEDNRPMLIGKANPALSGIAQLYVIIVPPDSEPNSKDLFWRELEEKVKNKLNKAGIQTIRGIAGNILSTGELRVYVDTLKLKDLQRYVFRIQTSLSRPVYLAKDSSWFIKADVWKKGSLMQAVSVQSMPAAVSNKVLQQVEAFIAAYLAANPPGTRPYAPNDITVKPEKLTKPDAKRTVAEYKYVASKNSKVFHKPDCRWVKRILAKNLVGYNSRDEAIEAGKRPCKLCKP